MQAIVIPLPATGCEHYCGRGCLLRATMDPCLHEQWRCAVVREWERAFDEYLDQVDQFDIQAETATRIWCRRLARLVRASACGERKPGGDSAVSCQNLYYGLCLLRLPKCEGRCENFKG